MCPETGELAPLVRAAIPRVKVTHPNSRYHLETGECPKHADCRFRRSSLEHQLSGGAKGKHNFKGKRCRLENERSDWVVNKAIPKGSVKARGWRKWLSLVEEFLGEMFGGRADARVKGLLYAQAVATSNFDRYSMTSMPTNQVLHERTGISMSGLRLWRSRLEEFGWLAVVGGGRTAAYAESGGNEAQVLVLCIPDWFIEQRRAARRARARRAFAQAVGKTWHPLTLKSDIKETTREGDAPKDGRANARLPFGSPDGSQAMAPGALGRLKRAAYRAGVGPGVPDGVRELGADAHRASEAQGRSRGRASFVDDVLLASQWLHANVAGLGDASVAAVAWAIKAKVKCGWNVSDLLDGIDFDPVTGRRRVGGGLEHAKYPARALRHRLDEWGTRPPAGARYQRAR